MLVSFLMAGWRLPAGGRCHGCGVLLARRLNPDTGAIRQDLGDRNAATIASVNVPRVGGIGDSDAVTALAELVGGGVENPPIGGAIPEMLHMDAVGTVATASLLKPKDGLDVRAEVLTAAPVRIVTEERR
jgi:hypothetical protein